MSLSILFPVIHVIVAYSVLSKRQAMANLAERYNGSANVPQTLRVKVMEEHSFKYQILSDEKQACYEFRSKVEASRKRRAITQAVADYKQKILRVKQGQEVKEHLDFDLLLDSCRFSPEDERIGSINDGAEVQRPIA